MSFLKRIGRSGEGFTLVEMTVVIAIIAVLAALALPAVTGVATDTRTTAKQGDQKQVETGVTRFDDQNAAFPMLGSTDPIDSESAVAGVLDIVVDTDETAGVVGFPSGTGVLVCGSDAGSVKRALDSCFANIDFTTNTATKLVPDYLKLAPQHPDELVSNDNGSDITGSGGEASADYTVLNCNLAGDTCEFYLHDTDNLSTADLNVWVLDGIKGVFTFKADAKYGQ